MYETSEDLVRLQRLIDASAEGAGPHLHCILSQENRVSATQLCARLKGMRQLVVATVTSDGRPLASPVDGYFIRGAWHFASARHALRTNHLMARPSISATYVMGEKLAVSTHGSAELFSLDDPERGELREAMLAHYLPLQGPDCSRWIDESDLLGARIEATRLIALAA